MIHSTTMETVTLNKPDDWHVHLRDGLYLETTVPHISERFARACIMPNLLPPITTVEQALRYREQILAKAPKNIGFNPLMSLFLTDQTSNDTVKEASKNDQILGFKYYPAGATTHSDSGVSDAKNLDPILERLEALQVPLQIHGEVTQENVDIFDRETVFIEQILAPIINKFPKLKVVLEHISTRTAVDFIKNSSENVAATITLHHLLLNRNDLLVNGLKPHHYCLPILKTADDQQALLDAAFSGNPKFFFGSDSAPHTLNKKESACGCAGVYTAHASIELLTHLFIQHGKIEQLNPFVGQFGANFYHLPISDETIILEAKPWKIPSHYKYGKDKLIPLFAGEQISWQLKNSK